jgi:hypothetical protein
LQDARIRVGDDDLGAFLRQQIRNRFADAVRTRAHICELALQLIVHATYL